MTSFIQSISYYPLKGFKAQTLEHVALVPNQGLAFDRGFAITNAQLLPAPDGEWTTCQAFVRLTKDISLPRFNVVFNANCMSLTLHHPDGEIINVTMCDARSVAQANQSLKRWFPVTKQAFGNAPQLISARAGLGYWDHSDAHLSIINSESVAQLRETAGKEIDPARFRGNLLVAGLPAWQELQWTGSRIQVGSVVLEVTRPIDRCVATSVHPTLGEIDINVPALLAKQTGHVFCGVYAKVITAGQIQTGDALRVLGRSFGTLKRASLPTTAPPVADWPRVGTVVDIEHNSDSVRSFWINDPLACEGLSPACKAGQHIRLHALGGNKAAWRIYTVSGTRADGSLRISVKREDNGSISSWLHDTLQLGSAISFSGPFGDFTLEDKVSNHITLISAGIGITPIVAMLEQLAKTRSDILVNCFHVSRNSKELALWPEVLQSLKAINNARVRLYLTRQNKQTGQSPFVFSLGKPDLTQITSDIVKVAPATQVFICGPSAFMRDVSASLQIAGVPSSRIHYEVFASPKVTKELATTRPLPGPFNVYFQRSNRRLEWTESSGSLLDLAESRGIVLPAKCRSGVCMTCAQTLQSGSVACAAEPIHKTSERNVLMCCSVPITDVIINA
jgi:ferredoxin-NADP reductase/uncharacterized protein YcbX